MEDISASVASSVLEEMAVVFVCCSVKENLLVLLTAAAGANAEAAAAVNKRVSRYFIIVFLGFAWFPVQSKVESPREKIAPLRVIAPQSE